MAFKNTLLLSLVVSAAGAIDINAQSTPPLGTSQVVDHAYPALAIAVHAFADYAGSTSANTFSGNLIANLANLKGSPVHIRVGGTSGDKATYVPSQTAAIEIPPGTTPGTIPKSVTLGPTWFQGFKNINALWTYMAHLNIANGEDNAIAATQQALKNIGNNLEAIEIGNEVNLYHDQGWSPAAFITRWKDYASRIESEVLKGTQYANTKIFQAPVLADGRKDPWTPQNILQQGINSGNNIKSVSCHNYQASYNKGLTLQKTFMNHSHIVNALSTYSIPTAFLAQNYPQISLHMGEDNSLLGGVNATNLVGVFGNALWMADYLLYGMTRNITQMNIQQITGVAYSSWRPVTYEDQQPAVYPPYYGQVFVADVMGTNANNKFQIHSLNLGLDEFSAYTIFQNGKLAKFVLINLQEYRANSGTRPSQQVNIKLDSATTSTSATVKTLTAPGADSKDGVSYAGQEYTYANNGKPSSVGSASKPVSITNHQFTINVPASEAILITLQ